MQDSEVILSGLKLYANKKQVIYNFSRLIYKIFIVYLFNIWLLLPIICTDIYYLFLI